MTRSLDHSVIVLELTASHEFVDSEFFADAATVYNVIHAQIDVREVWFTTPIVVVID
jgi:hypothetical protein